MISGLASGARFSTIFLRMLIGFMVVASLVWLASYLFRHYFFSRLVRLGIMDARLAGAAAAESEKESGEDSLDEVPPAEDLEVSEEASDETDDAADFSPLGQEVPRLQVVEEPKDQV